MKRKQLTVLFCIVLGIASLAHPVYAAIPTPVPPTVATVPIGIKIPNGVNNVIIESQHGPDYEPTPGDPYKITIPGADVSTDNFNIPKKLEQIGDWLTNVLPFMNAQTITNKVIPHQNNLYISGQARRCIYLPGASKPIENVGDTYKTELVEYLPKLMTATELLSANTVRNVVSLKAGSYDFRGPSYEVDKAPPRGSTGEGTDQDPKQVTLAQTFSIPSIIEFFQNLVKIKRELVSKQQTPEADRIHCLLNGCVQSGADLEYIGDGKKQEVINKSGGIVDAGFRTNSMDTTKGENPNGQEENFTKTNTSYTKQMENSANLIKCSLVPKGKRGTIGLTEEDCADFVKKPCDTKLPDLSKYQQGCTLKNTQLLTTSGNYLTEYQKLALPQGDLPQLAKDIINAAGNIYKVPPALILATMVSEGSFQHPALTKAQAENFQKLGMSWVKETSEKDAWMWTDENVKKWSVCKGKVPMCEAYAHPDTGSKGPVGWIDGWFFEESDKYYAGVQAVQERTKEQVSNCNFMDAIFALAKSMQKTSGGVTYPYTTCWGHPLLMKGGPSTSCTWNEARVTTATRQYAGYCSEPPKNGSYSPQTKNNNHFDRAWTFYKTFQ